jgi:hypothetical protein
VFENHVGAFDLRKFGPVGLLLILTVSLVIFTAPGTFGTVLGDTVIPPPPSLPGLATLNVTVHDCAGNPVQSAVIQAQSFTWGGWTYTNSNGNAILPVLPGTYTTNSNGSAFFSLLPGTYILRGGYSTYYFNETIGVGSGGYTVTVSLGAGCSGFSIAYQISSSAAGRVAR